MRPHWFPLVLVLSGCDQATAPSRQDALPAAAASARVASRSSGAVVVRFEGNTPEVGLFIYDADQQLLAALATDDSHFGCVTGTELGHSNDQLVETPAGAATYLSRVDQVYLSIYRWDGTGALSCALLTGPRLAFGIVPGLLHANDIFGSGQHAGTFGMGVRGDVTLADGTVRHAMAHFLDLTTPDGVVRSQFARVQLTAP